MARRKQQRGSAGTPAVDFWGGFLAGLTGEHPRGVAETRHGLCIRQVAGLTLDARLHYRPGEGSDPLVEFHCTRWGRRHLLRVVRASEFLEQAEQCRQTPTTVRLGDRWEEQVFPQEVYHVANWLCDRLAAGRPAGTTTKAHVREIEETVEFEERLAAAAETLRGKGCPPAEVDAFVKRARNNYYAKLRQQGQE